MSKLAATVEFIHTATLLHDDVVDESTQRRGRPTANLLWDNKSSVLVGDYLFARSVPVDGRARVLRVLAILANASAVIAEGEVLQLTAAQNLATTEAIYLQVIRGKTAALFSAATEVGGVIAGAPEAGDRRCSIMAMRWGSRSRSPMTCWIMAAPARDRQEHWATISANAS
jgi:octaprenyl-diphosphate synthase